MQIPIAAIGLVLFTSFAVAQDNSEAPIYLLHSVQTGECSLDVSGKSIWSGKCCVDITANDGAKGFDIDVHAMGWRACLYEKHHPRNAQMDGAEKTCLGPWIDISQDPEANTLSAYWSVEGGCHAGDKDTAEEIMKTGEGLYVGKNFQFRWKPQY